MHRPVTLSIRLGLLLIFGSTLSITQAMTLQDAREQFLAGKLKPALAQTNVLLKADPDSIPSLFLKAQIQTESQQLDNAIDTYKMLISLAPGHIQSYNNLAALYAQQGKLKLASEMLEQGISTDPVFMTIHTNLRAIYMDMSQKHYRQALKLKTDNRSTLIASIDIDSSADQILSEEIQVVPESIQDAIDMTVANENPPVKRTSRTSKSPAPAATKKPRPAPKARKKPDTKVAASVSPEKQTTTTIRKEPGKPHSKPRANPVVDPAPASQTTPAASPDKSSAREVKKALLAWANAWSNRDAEKYVSAYTDSYATFGRTNKDWVAGRRWNFKNKKYIKVALSNIHIEAVDKQYQARFEQQYESDTYKDIVNKELLFIHQTGRWKIAKEVSN